MNRLGKTITVLVLAFCVLPAASLAADDGPIVHDYSKMGAADYNAPAQKNDAGATDSDSQKNSQKTEASSASGSGEEGKPYVVDCTGKDPCKVSKDVMVGYEQYGGHCLRCHGETAEGSSFAPSLVDRLKGKGQGAFTAAVAGGITRKDPSTGMYRVMPSWAGNEEVMSHVQQLWAFLKARSDGALPPGRPQLKGDNG